jgi:hypothetical protein
MSEDLTRFVDAQVIDIVRRSMIYKHLLKSKDHESLTDISLGTCSINILCYLKTKYKKKLFTQRTLCDITKLAAKQILVQKGIYQTPEKIST